MSRIVLTILLLLVVAPLSAASPDLPPMVLKLVESIEVPAQETGPLAELRVAEGQIVHEGDVLAQIDDTEARLAVERAKIECAVARSNARDDVNVRFAKKEVEVARAELQRSLDSIKRYPKSISDSEMDRLKLIVEKSVLEVEQAEHEFALCGLTEQIKASDLQAAQAKVQRHRIAAAAPGVVVQLRRHHGEWVRPGDPVLRILRLDRLKAEGFLRSQDARPELLGRAVKLAVDMPGEAARIVEGKVSFIDPEIDPVNSQVRVWIEVPNGDLRLRAGMRAKLITAETKQD